MIISGGRNLAVVAGGQKLNQGHASHTLIRLKNPCPCLAKLMLLEALAQSSGTTVLTEAKPTLLPVLRGYLGWKARTLPLPLSQLHFYK